MSATPTRALPQLLGYAFRVFFVLVGAWSALAMALWTGALNGWPLTLTPTWHAHELIFAVVGGAAAGFLLTAGATWTRTPPVAGPPLAALAVLWLAGRATMLMEPLLPAALIGAVNTAFLPAVAAVLARRLIAAGNRRNYLLPVVLLLLAVTQGLWHAGRPALAGEAALLLVAVLITIIGGRIAPAFTRNALRARGIDASVTDSATLASANIALVLGAGLAALIAPGAVSGALALAAALLGALRLRGWRTGATLGEPLLWILHLAWLWLLAGLAARGLADLGVAVPRSLWIHLLGAGAIGTILIGVMTRVSLGHTGRALELPNGAVWLYAGVLAAAVLRTLAAVPAVPYAAVLIDAAGALWAAAWLGFLWLFAPILAAPRADGHPG